jgi:hypothetical protein
VKIGGYRKNLNKIAAFRSGLWTAKRLDLATRITHPCDRIPGRHEYPFRQTLEYEPSHLVKNAAFLLCADS